MIEITDGLWVNPNWSQSLRTWRRAVRHLHAGAVGNRWWIPRGRPIAEVVEEIEAEDED